MRISVNLTENRNIHDGISVYLQNILSRCENVEINGWAILNRNEDINKETDLLKGIYPFINVKLKKTIFTKTQLKLIYNFQFPINYKKLIGNADIYLFFNNFMPKNNIKGKKITFIHDLTPIKSNPSRLKNKMYMDRYKYSIKHSDLIITVSNYSKEDIIKTFPQANGKVKVVYNGVNTTKFSEEIESEKQEKVQNKYNLPPKYILFVGQARENKNLKRLLKAYSLLSDEIKNKYGLVFANTNQELVELSKELKIDKNVRLLNGIANEDLVAVYKMSSVFALVSLNEGFGIPLIEAMGAGIPVICSNISCLPEVVGEAAVLVDPYSEEDISNGLERILNDNELRQDLIKKGYERIKLFTWENSVQKFKEYLSDLIK